MFSQVPAESFSLARLLERRPLVGVAPQLPAGGLPCLWKQGDRAGHVYGAEIVELLLAALERNGQEAVDPHLSAGRAAQLEDRPISRVDGHKARHQHHSHPQQPALHPVSTFLQQTGFTHRGNSTFQVLLQLVEPAGIPRNPSACILRSGAGRFGREDLIAISPIRLGLVKSGIGASEQRFAIEFPRQSRADPYTDSNRYLIVLEPNGTGQSLYDVRDRKSVV